MTLDWLHVIFLLGATQGVLLAGVLVTKQSNRTANRLLSALMACFSVYLATAVYHATGFIRAFPHFYGVAYPLPFLFGPLIYLYAVTVADRGRGLARRDVLHLLPFLAVVIAGLPIYLLGADAKIALAEQMQRGTRPLLVTVADPLKFTSGIAYAVATLVFLRRHRERVKESYSSTERVNLRWLLLLGGAAAGIWLLAVALPLLEVSGAMRIARGDDFVALAIAVFVYAIGYRGLRQSEVFRYETAEYPVQVQATQLAISTQQTRDADAVSTAQVDPESETAGPRYERSGLGERQGRRLQESLLALMEREQPWKDSGLTLADLAERLSTTPHRLSEVLNVRLGQTFYDFVNGYRVREVERRIAAGEAERATMLSLALDAGFASKSTFNVVFKKHTSRTPSKYRQAAGT